MTNTINFTADEREEIRFQNEQALKGMPGVEVDDHDQTRPHNLDLFNNIMASAYGQNMKGRFGYSLNRIAANICRTALRDSLKSEEKDENLESCLSDEDINLMFGFESAPQYTLDQACHWMMITFLFTHDIAQFTEANDQGVKTKPYGWMEEQIKNPMTLCYSDMQYRIKAAVDTQVVQMIKLGYADVGGVATEEFKKKETILAQGAFAEKIAMIKGVCDMRMYKDTYETDQLVEAIEDMIATLGLDVPAICEDIAQKYKDGRIAKVRAGDRVGDVDERILELLPEGIQQVGTRHKEGALERISSNTVANIEAGAAFTYEQNPLHGGVNIEAYERSMAVRAEKAAKEAAEAAEKAAKVVKKPSRRITKAMLAAEQAAQAAAMN
jgi:hypothetical protein